MAGNVMKGDASGRGAVEGYRVSIPARQRPYTEAEIAVVVDAMRNVQGQTQGAKQEQFQQDFAAFTGANHAFAVANGRGVPRDHRRLGQGRYRRPEGCQMCGVAARPITGGVLVPACSPCDERDVFLEDVFAASLAESLREPLDGAYLCGGTGDGMHMRLEERKAAIRIGVSLCKKAGKCSLVQVGAPTMRDALELAAYAAECGADGISSVPLGGFDHSAQMRYYRSLLSAADGLPAILYYMPQPGVSFTLDQILETLSIEGVSGIKCSSSDLFFTERLIAEKPAGKVLFNGKDEYLAPAVIHGAEGGIGMWATVFPRAYASIYHHARNSELAAAFRLQKQLNALCCMVMRHGLLESYAAILHYLGLHARVFRAPQPQFNPRTYDEFIERAAPLIDQLRAYPRPPQPKGGLA